MADIRVAKRLRELFPARNISAIGELLMGIVIASGSSGAGGTVAFFQSRTHLDALILGVGFILSGLITLLTNRLRVYVYTNAFVLGSYALVALYGWLVEHIVPAQSSIFAAWVCLLTLWVFPEETNGEH